MTKTTHSESLGSQYDNVFPLKNHGYVSVNKHNYSLVFSRNKNTEFYNSKNHINYNTKLYDTSRLSFQKL
jgi:hypothetical protein